MSRENELLFQVFFQVLCLSLVYDGIEAFRHRLRHKQILIWFEDMLYWVVTTYKLFCTLQTYGNGTVRWYLVLCAVLAVVIYRKGIRKYPIHWLSLLLKSLFRPIHKKNT